MLSIQQQRSNPFFVLLSLPATAMGFALCIQISALSWILSTKYHLAIHEVGYVWLAGPLAGLLAQPVVGLISDNVWLWGGRRRPFIIIGGVLASLMLLALPYLGELSQWSGIGILWVAVGVALLLDLSINVGFNPTRSIIADVTAEGLERTKGFTWMQTISGMFGVLAYVIGAVLGNYTLIFTGVGLVVLFNVVAAFLIEEPRDLRPAATQEAAGAAGGRTHMAKLIHIYTAHGFTWLGVQTMFVFVFAYIKHAMNLPGLTDAKIGEIINVAFLVLNTVGFLLPVLVLQPVAKRIGLVRTHAICIAIMAAGYASIVAYAARRLRSTCSWPWSASAGRGRQPAVRHHERQRGQDPDGPFHGHLQSLHRDPAARGERIHWKNHRRGREQKHGLHHRRLLAGRLGGVVVFREGKSLRARHARGFRRRRRALARVMHYYVGAIALRASTVGV